MREEKPRQGDLTFSGGGKLKPARGSERPGGMTDVEAPGGRNPAGPMTAGGLGGSGRSEPSRPRGGRWFFFSKWWKPSDQRIWRRKLPADLTSRHRKRWGTRARGKPGPGRRRCLWLWTLGRGVWEDVWRVSLGFKEDLQGAQKRGIRWDINDHRNLDRGRNHAGQKVGLETETRPALRRDRL